MPTKLYFGVDKIEDDGEGLKEVSMSVFLKPKQPSSVSRFRRLSEVLSCAPGRSQASVGIVEPIEATWG